MNVELTYPNGQKAFMHGKCYEKFSATAAQNDASMRRPPETVPDDARCEICREPMDAFRTSHPLSADFWAYELPVAAEEIKRGQTVSVDSDGKVKTVTTVRRTMEQEKIYWEGKAHEFMSKQYEVSMLLREMVEAYGGYYTDYGRWDAAFHAARDYLTVRTK